MSENKKTTKTNEKTTAQKVSDVAHKEVFMKNLDRDIFTRSVLILSVAINLVTFVAVVLLDAGIQIHA